jgi:trimeric autotransporter adhesin
VVPAAPGTPGAPTATAGNAQATVTVAAPSTGGTPSSYTVTATDATTGANGGQTCTVTGATGSCTLTGLTNGDSYTFTSTAANPGGTSLASPASNMVTPAAPATAPGAPTIGTATAGPVSATVTFTPPTSNGGSAITSYTVTATDHTKAARGGHTAKGTASPITVGGLTNGDSYSFTVTATNTVGTGPASTASNAVTPEATKPSADLKIALSTPVKTKAGTYIDTVTIIDNGPSTATTIISGLTVTNGLTVTAAPGGLIIDRGAAVAYSTASVAEGKSVTFTVTLSAGNKANGIQTITAATASLTVADPNYKNNVTTTTP